MLSRPPIAPVRGYYCDSSRWAPYVPRDGDIVIATAPKVGTTWMQQIVSLLVFQSTEAKPLHFISPWLDCRLRDNLGEQLALLEMQTHRRYIKSHLPFSALPVWDEVKYIHVARDGRDACLSYLNHNNAYTAGAWARLDAAAEADLDLPAPAPRPPRDARGFFHHWIAPGGTAAAEQMGDGFFEIERAFWAERTRSNLLLVHYADLKTDLDGEMRRISAFLDIPVDETIWPSLVEAADFESMKAAGADLMPGAEMSFEGGHNTFLNKGTNGRWQTELTAGDLALYQQRVATELSPSLARWLEHGRLATGDPVTAAD
ncbi:MAG: sulfotransferase domain-containing protein [Caulobacter sp.]|nr:sulfotransferase domain-containing protein [Caulobacter sp.]